MSGSGGGSRSDISPKNISLGEETYDPNEARKILEGSLEQRVVNYAEIKYGKGKEIAVRFKTENYREEPNKDPLDVLDSVCGKPEVLEAEVVGSIDDVVNSVQYQPKPSMLKVAVRGTKNLINKTCWYYPFLGALSRNKQEERADKYGDDPMHYTKSNVFVESIAVSAGTWYFDVKYPLLIGIVYFVVSVCYKGVRGNFQEPVGNPLVEIPSYLAKKIKEAYVSAYQQEQQRLLQNRGKFKILPVRPRPPPPETAKTAEALPRIETQARIEESEIVPDEELEDFDQGLKERNGAP